MEDIEPDMGTKSSLFGQTKRMQECENIANSYNFKEFDIREEMKDSRNFAALMLAPRRGGKTTMLRDLLSKIYNWYTKVYVFSETSHLQPDMFNFCPKENIFRHFSEEKLKEICDSQEDKIVRLLKLGVPKKEHPIVLLVFDDCINDHHIRSSPTFIKLHAAGRHLALCSIVLSQEVGGKYGINKVCRANCDLLISFFIKAEGDRELIIEQYLSQENKNVGYKIYKNITKEKYKAIVVCNFKNDQNPEETIYWYLAKEKVKKFMVGQDVKKGKVHYIEDVRPTALQYLPRFAPLSGTFNMKYSIALPITTQSQKPPRRRTIIKTNEV